MTKNHIVNLFAIASLSLASAALAQDAGAAPKNADAPAHKEKKEKGEKKAKEHKAVEVGEKVPDFSATDVDGKTVKDELQKIGYLGDEVPGQEMLILDVPW